MDKTPKRLLPNADALSQVGNARELRCLETLVWAGLLSTGQIERLFFPSRRRAQRRLRALFDHGLVRAHLQTSALHLENVYTPTPLALDLLEDHVGFEDGRPRLARFPRPQRLAHALAVREVFVALLVAEKAGVLRLLDFRFEEELAAEPVFRGARIVPDAVAELAVGDDVSTVGVEVDLGTETTAALRAKLDAWRALLARRGAPVETLLLVAATPRRARTLTRLATEAHLPPSARVVLSAELGVLFGAGWPRPVAAAPGRAERRPGPAQRPATTPIFKPRGAAFQVLDLGLARPAHD